MKRGAEKRRAEERKGEQRRAEQLEQSWTGERREEVCKHVGDIKTEL